MLASVLSWLAQVSELIKQSKSALKFAKSIAQLPQYLLDGLHRLLDRANTALPDVAEKCQQIERLWRGVLAGVRQLCVVVTTAPPERRKTPDRRRGHGDRQVDACRRLRRRRGTDRLLAA